MHRINLTSLAIGLAAAILPCSAMTQGQPAPTESLQQENQTTGFHLIPYPDRLSPGTGSFTLGSSTTIAVSDLDDPELRALADFASGLLRQRSGIVLSLASAAATGPRPNALVLRLDSTGDVQDSESYRLAVTPTGVTISAASHAGLFYGLQTLRQLIAPAGSSARSGEAAAGVPVVEIEDRPRFVYRGMHLDVGRHFFPVEFVKKYIDLMAMYKMNTFHWHLTEDQGWRIEIERYPRLTEVGGFRKETILAKNFDPYIGDRKPYGGFYTQDEIRDVVAYARSRYVTVIPEIEMPGHSTAALAAYPELACSDGPFEVATVWGVHPDIYCPSEQTFAFLEGVLSEILDLFPSRYIHIGGDEAPKVRWEESALAQEIIRLEGLADEHELQSYFIKRIERFLLAHDRRLIGWDEILEGGLAPQATVMSWRGTAGGIEAARQGHDVIMTPTSHVYFDYYQGDPLYEPLAIGGYTPLEKVYAFEPVPDELTPEEAKHVLGAQGNVWTEYMPTQQYVEYMVFPRMLALAEVLWSPGQARAWERFAANLTAHFRLLDDFRVNYRVPSVTGLEVDRITLDPQITIALSATGPGTQIRYTTDGTDPSPGSPLYSGPFLLAVGEQGVQVTARVFLPNGRSSPVRSATFRRVSPMPALQPDSGTMAPGLRYAYYESAVSSVHQLVFETPSRESVADQISLEDFESNDRFALEFRGFVEVPESAVYTFYLTSDDGSELAIGGQTVVDNDGYHVLQEKAGMVALEAGFHPIAVRYFQGGGGMALSLEAEIEGRVARSRVELRFAHRR